MGLAPKLKPQETVKLRRRVLVTVHRAIASGLPGDQPGAVRRLAYFARGPSH